MLTRQENHVDHLLRNLAEELDIPLSKYDQAVNRYQSVGSHIERVYYPSASGESLCYCQGSFRLGTVVRPIKEGKESDYDIDLVAQLPIAKNKTSPGEVKHLVGNRLKVDARYNRMLKEEGKRCWTIEYAEEDGIGFHLDVLPAISEVIDIQRHLRSLPIPADAEKYAIAITHKDESMYDWRSSNPAGYAEWFEAINRKILPQIDYNERSILVEKHPEIYARVEDVPPMMVKTPLQRAIQIFKRHRDIRFANSKWEKDKPISMIITTITTRSFSGKPASTVLETIRDLITDLRQSSYGGLITKNGGGWYIPNPVNPEENFADKWHEDGDKKARAFFMWLDWLEQDIEQLLHVHDLGKARVLVPALFGDRVASGALNKLESRFGGSVFKQIAHQRVQINHKPESPWQRG